jgi:hypothetical protein
MQERERVMRDLQAGDDVPVEAKGPFSLLWHVPQHDRAVCLRSPNAVELL